MLRQIERLTLRLLARADAVGNLLYSSRYNPLYQSGTIAVALYVALVVTGLWLILFYRVGSPWASVAGVTASPWIAGWVRSLHRYASDAAVVATGVHALRMFAQGRSWGARTTAWVSGVGLLLLLMACGWTGYVMVWDTFGEALAREGARMIDSLPILSEPLGRAFTGERPVPSVFFFLNLFAHIGIPLAMGVGFWLHVKHLARPLMLPPRRLMWAIIAALTAVAIVWPVAMAPEANALVIPTTVPVDLFFAFWMPVTRVFTGAAGLATATGLTLLVLAVPAIARPRGPAAPAPSRVDEDICVGCLQCAEDCPYDAIAMIPRTSRRSDLVARVDPAQCVSCGICAGSCAPMGVGPPGRAGRDQISAVDAFVLAPDRCAGEVIVMACGHGAGRLSPALKDSGGVPYAVECVGNVHSSVIERLLRGGAGGVLLLTCPSRDCHHREGPKWLDARVYHGREAELQPRVDRARIRIAEANASEPELAVAALRSFASEIAAMSSAAGPADEPSETACATPTRPMEHTLP